ELLATRQAVRSLVGRTERRVALPDEGELTMHVPIVRRDRRRKAQLARGGLRIRGVEVPGEAQPDRMEIERRLVAGAGRERDADVAESVVQILDGGGPVRRNGKLGTRADDPAGPPMQNLVLVGAAGAFEKARLRPGKSAGAVDEPVVERVTDAAAHGCDVV